MVYMCPTCYKECATEEEVTKHFLKCWKDNNPHCKSKPAPRSADIIRVVANEEMQQFFEMLGGNTDARDNG